jgi:hypothetical protein
VEAELPELSLRQTAVRTSSTLEEYVGIKYGNSSFAGTALIIFTSKSAFAPIWSNCTILSEFDQIVN